MSESGLVYILLPAREIEAANKGTSSGTSRNSVTLDHDFSKNPEETPQPSKSKTE
jgi:hypothetical protein